MFTFPFSMPCLVFLTRPNGSVFVGREGGRGNYVPWQPEKLSPSSTWMFEVNKLAVLFFGESVLPGNPPDSQKGEGY